jgi:ribosomal protein L40E
MPSSIVESAHRFQQRLTRLDNQPLSKAALVVIIFLDIFVLGTIFNGLANHTRQLESPNETIPTLCSDIVVDADWNPANRLDRLAQLVTRYRVYQTLPDARSETVPKHALCAPIVSAYLTILNDNTLAQDLEQMTRLDRQMRDVRAAQAKVKGAYDTKLLEQIASQPQANANVAAIRKESGDTTSALDSLVEQRSALGARIEQDPRVQALYARIEGITETDRAALRAELKRLNFWHPAKRLGMEMLFLLPLLGVFYFWNARSIRADRHFQTLVSSHLLVVASIPVVLKLGELVHDIIPRRLLRQLMELLESWKLVAIWDYLVIAAAIMTALVLIYVLQKKLFSHERLMQRRIAKGLCQECGQHLPPGSRHCPACGAAQFRACPQCGEPMHVHGRYCMACGHASLGK